MLNGDTLHSKVGQGNLIGKRLEEKVAPEQIVEELYIRCLTRRPTDKEKNELNVIIAEVEDKKQVLEDVFWALLNSREFVFNH